MRRHEQPRFQSRLLRNGLRHHHFIDAGVVRVLRAGGGPDLYLAEAVGAAGIDGDDLQPGDGSGREGAIGAARSPADHVDAAGRCAIAEYKLKLIDLVVVRVALPAIPDDHAMDRDREGPLEFESDHVPADPLRLHTPIHDSPGAWG